MAVDQILLVELDPTLRAILQEVCSEDGLDVTPCRTLPDVGSAITGLPGQVVLLDEQDVEGLVAEDFQSHIRGLATHVPVVILASSAEGPHVGLDARDVSVVPMPFDIDDLLGVIRGAIRPARRHV